jgi:hypothetical protein
MNMDMCECDFCPLSALHYPFELRVNNRYGPTVPFCFFVALCCQDWWLGGEVCFSGRGGDRMLYMLGFLKF